MEQKVMIIMLLVIGGYFFEVQGSLVQPGPEAIARFDETQRIQKQQESLQRSFQAKYVSDNTFVFLGTDRTSNSVNKAILRPVSGDALYTPKRLTKYLQKPVTARLKKGTFVTVDVYIVAGNRSGFIIDDNSKIPVVTLTKKLYEDQIPLDTQVYYLLFSACIEGKLIEFEVEVNNFASLDEWRVRGSEQDCSDYLEIIR